MLQNLYDLSDEGTVAEVIDSRAFSEFCGVDSSNQVPNGEYRMGIKTAVDDDCHATLTICQAQDGKYVEVFS